MYLHRHDSVVSDKINYDLLKKMKDIQSGALPCPELLGQNFITKTREQVPEALAKAESCSC
jgi:glutamate--cysteine ligase catalytic subunit